MFRFVVFLAILKGAIGVQPEAPSPKPAPLRELPWAQLNFLHTTDIHGWWGGHLQEYVILLPLLRAYLFENPVSRISNLRSMLSALNVHSHV